MRHLPIHPSCEGESDGHQTYDDNVDPKQGYSHAKFERSCFIHVQEKANNKAFFKQENMSIISLEHV